MKVLSLFDGMACGMLAFRQLGIEVDSYDAYEIDKYAIKTATHNFPSIKENGDVFTADFTKYKGVDFVVGGSPCTYWSVTQKNNRETEASGMGWELFSQYVRAIKEAEPKYFIYENNYSMSAAIRESINRAFGFEAVFINSALVSAQTRKRLYWVGKRNADGSYSKVDVKQPNDRGILLRDILESTTGAIRIPEYGENEKARTLNGNYQNNCGGFEHRIWNDNPKKQQVDLVAEPIRVGTMPRSDGEMIDHQQSRVYSINGKSTNLNANGGGWGAKTGLYACPIKTLTDGEIDYMFRKEGRMEYGYIQNASNDKAKCITANIHKGVPYNVMIERADGSLQPIYKVEGGYITIKGKQYPIKLADGYYIIRKLTVSECKRLQTVPEWYDFPVSDAQAYKMLGNGWTIEVIAHLITAALSNKTAVDDMVQISLFDAV